MADEWIIEVLSDLRNFARQNDLPDLAAELDQTLAVAFRTLGRKIATVDIGIAEVDLTQAKAGKRH